MSWARTIATGSGTLRWRVAIDGFPFECVSHREMERTASDGRIRYVGIRSSGYRFSEQINGPRAEPDADPVTVTFVDVGGRWTEAFGKSPERVTYLAANEDNTTNSIDVASTDGWPSSGTFYLNSEAIRYASKDATHFLGCSRGSFGSLAQYHYVEWGANLRNPEVTDWPRSIEGRRVRFYVYGSGDDPQGNGTQVWIGLAGTEPRNDGLDWKLSVKPIFSALDVDIGTDLDEPRRLRGIYYSAHAPLHIELLEYSTASPIGSTLTARTELLLAGQWEHQEDFCADLTTHIATVMGAPTLEGTFTVTAPTATPIGSSWGLRYVTGATPKFLDVRIRSAVDGTLLGATWIDDTTNEAASTLSGSRLYRLGLLASPDVPAPGAVPRTTLGFYAPTGTHVAHLPAANKINVDPATYPAHRLYIDTPALASVTRVQLEWPGADGETLSTTARVVAMDSTDAWIELDGRDVRALLPGGRTAYIAVTGDAAEAVSIRLTRDIATGTLSDFVAGLMAATSQYVNTGAVPFIRPLSGGVFADFDLATSELSHLEHNPSTSGRHYTLLASTNLKDLLVHECRLAGVYMAMNAAGQIAFRRMRLPSISEARSATINASSIIVSDELYTFEKAPWGMFNTVRFMTGYDPAEDEHKGTPIKVRDLTAYGANPHPRVIEIAPKSVDGAPLTIEAAIELAQGILGVYGAPYRMLDIRVPMTHFGRLLGDVVAISWRLPPNAAGTRGLSDEVGIVLGREWTPGEAVGRLSLLLSETRVGGYAPAAKIASIDSGTSGTTGPFVVTTDTTYRPSGTTNTSWWAVDDKVRVYRWNSTTASAVNATVTAVGANTLTFTTAANWTYSGATWVVGPQPSTAITSSNQKRFVANAGADALLDWSDETDVPPFRFA